MSCPEDKHDLRAVTPFIHPTEGIEVIGAPPQTREEPAWCRNCGALWCKLPFDMGWGWAHPVLDKDAPTLLNIMRKHIEQDDKEIHELPMPSQLDDLNIEAIRGWFTGTDKRHLRTQTIINLAFFENDPGLWGILLADIARQVAEAAAGDTGILLAKIQQYFEAELATPTGEDS
jgi:hypothetical protein